MGLLTAREYLAEQLPKMRERRRELATRMRIIGLGAREVAELERLESTIARLELMPNQGRKPPTSGQ